MLISASSRLPKHSVLMQPRTFRGVLGEPGNYRHLLVSVITGDHKTRWSTSQYMKEAGWEKWPPEPHVSEEGACGQLLALRLAVDINSGDRAYYLAGHPS